MTDGENNEKNDIRDTKSGNWNDRNYHEETADRTWITDHVVAINETVLDVCYDSYDWRYTK